MKIAAITITYNDGYKFKEWCQWYEEYKDEIDIHIIVDNHSVPEYLQQVKNYFKNSIIIERTSNGGCTGAYNDGIRFALSDSEVDAIMLIGNDVKLEKGGTNKLYEFLCSDLHYGMVSPVILKKDSEIIEIFGTRINLKTLAFEHQNVNVPLANQKNDIELSDGLPGGMNMAKRNFYEVVGLQDEYLFMYSDEVDMGIRAKKHGFLMVVTKNILSWHQHINPKHSVARSPLAGYLMGRNEIYLAKKHFGFYIVWSTIRFGIKRALIFNVGALVKKKAYDEKRFCLNYMIGVFAGLFSISKIPFIKK